MTAPGWLWFALSMLILSAGLYFRPHHAQCPERWHHDGVRRSGHFACTRNPVGDPDYDGTFGKPDRSRVPAGEIRGRVYCAYPRFPVVVDERTVQCR
jgi:hypothetical protein